MLRSIPWGAESSIFPSSKENQCVPIFVDGAFIGAVGACGLLLDEGEVDGFLIEKVTGITEEQTEQLAQGVPAIDSAKAHAVAQDIETSIEAVVAEYQAAASS